MIFELAEASQHCKFSDSVSELMRRYLRCDTLSLIKKITMTKLYVFQKRFHCTQRVKNVVRLRRETQMCER